MAHVVTYRLAYLDQEVDLCDACAGQDEHGCGTLGPVQRGRHWGSCEGERHPGPPPYYVVVTRGTRGTPNIGAPAWRRSLDDARSDADQACGSGSCTSARVYECDTREIAQGRVGSRWEGTQAGERLVYEACDAVEGR